MRRVFPGLLIVLFAAGLYGAVPAETDEILAELSKIRLDKAQIYNIRDITIRRDVFAITFTRGTIAFLQPVAGKVTGAIFIGSGDIVGIPPDTPGQVEKQELFRFTGSPILTESFDTAYFRFTDGTYEEILKEYQDRAQEDVTPDEREQLLPFEDELGGAEGALNYRVLADFLSSSSHPLFWAQLKNDKYGWFSATYDQRLAEEVSITKTFEATTELGGVWASFNRRAEVRDFEAAANEEKSPIDIVNYAIDATIGDSTTLQAKATVRFVPRWDGERVVSFLTSPYVTVSSVTSENGDALTFHQKEGFTDAEVERLGRNHFIVVMPEAMPVGREIALTIAYSGDVLQQATGDLVYTGDRGIWYPANDTSDRANFDLTFHYPDGFNLVATGVKTGQTQEGATQHATWKSSDSLMAGFAVGDLSFHADASNPLAATVVVSKDAGVVFRDTDPFRPAPPPVAAPVLPATPPGPRRNRTRDLPPPVVIAPPPPPVNYGVDPSRFGDAMLREVRSNVDFLRQMFGSYPFSTLTATPMMVGFREGLPSLLTLGSISFLDRDQRARLNIPEEVFARSERLRSADIARQWLGHSVGSRSYRDQWLFDGLSTYAALLYVENKYKNGRLVQELTRLRSDLQETSGPVWIGLRLGARAAALQESKGAWIMRMLHTQMGDDAFFAMTREFVEQYKGKSANTWDFKRLAEKHMNPAMDISRDGKLDWFFDSWVFGAPIPTYSLEYKVEPEGSGFAVSGKITQSGVPDDFLMSVPVHADGQLLGRVTVSADDGEFRFASTARPQRVELDPETTVLAVISR